jgi:lipoyl(octanoyl) transferase
MPDNDCLWINLNEKVPYRYGLALQQAAYKAVEGGRYNGVVFALEHNPVYTFGASGGRENLLVPADILEAQGIDLVPIKRGGNITYHGPGQLVIYPVVDLKKLKPDLHWYVHALEESVILTLKDFGIQGGRKPEYRGAWVGDEKIAALGVQFKRWITLHGLAFNISVDKTAFTRMNPCGITEFGVCSLADHYPDPSVTAVRDIIRLRLGETLGTNFIMAENPWKGIEAVEAINV